MIVLFNHYVYKTYTCNFWSSTFFLAILSLFIEYFVPIILLSYIAIKNANLPQRIVSWSTLSQEDGVLGFESEKLFVQSPKRNYGDILNGRTKLTFLLPLEASEFVSVIRYKIPLICTLKSIAHKNIKISSMLTFETANLQDTTKNKHLASVSIRFNQLSLISETFKARDYLSSQLDDLRVLDSYKNFTLSLTERHLWQAGESGYFNSTVLLQGQPQRIDFDPPFLYKFKWFFVYYIFLWAVLFFALNRVKRSLFDKSLIPCKRQLQKAHMD